jgi:uncharacterized protein (TIGR01777 family)
MPPWQPVHVVAEATSLKDGEAVLGLPGGVRWVAQHQPDAYDPPHRFVDELTSRPLREVLRWRHTHEFADEGDSATRVTDLVDTSVPDRWLRPMFGYRHRQLADDLAAHQWGRALRPEPLTVAVTGSSGLVGAALSAFLSSGGHRVVHLVRHPASGPDERQWRPYDPEPDLLDGVDAVVHLAGESIAGRFTPEHKHAILTSRTGPTIRLAELAARAAGAGRAITLVSASAVGFYGADRGDEILTESSNRGDGFLADVVEAWEAAARPAADAGARVAHVRTGIVLSPRGGVLRLQRPLFSVGLGGRLGMGAQWTPWIGIDDLVDIYYRSLLELSGPVNAVAPYAVRNREYTATLARVLRRPALVAVPPFGPKVLLGSEGAEELAFANQHVQPERLLAAGHRFRFPELEPALRHLLGRAP